MIRKCNCCGRAIADNESAWKFGKERFCSPPCVKQHIKGKPHEPKDTRT